MHTQLGMSVWIIDCCLRLAIDQTHIGRQPLLLESLHLLRDGAEILPTSCRQPRCPVGQERFGKIGALRDADINLAAWQVLHATDHSCRR